MHTDAFSLLTQKYTHTHIAGLFVLDLLFNTDEINRKIISFTYVATRKASCFVLVIGCR